MHSHVVLKKQIVLLVENGDKLPNSTFNKACIWLIQPKKKRKEKGMHLIHFWKVPRRTRLLLCPKQRNWIWLVPPNMFTKIKDTTCDNPDDWCLVFLKFHEPIQYSISQQLHKYLYNTLLMINNKIKFIWSQYYRIKSIVIKYVVKNLVNRVKYIVKNFVLSYSSRNLSSTTKVTWWNSNGPIQAVNSIVNFVLSYFSMNLSSITRVPWWNSYTLVSSGSRNFI